jgi:hypothetical protein
MINSYSISIFYKTMKNNKKEYVAALAGAVP